MNKSQQGQSGIEVDQGTHEVPPGGHFEVFRLLTFHLTVSKEYSEENNDITCLTLKILESPYCPKQSADSVQFFTKY